jgi:hypothetical protein
VRPTRQTREAWPRRVVFGCAFPKTYLGYPAINGDELDLRHLNRRNVIVGLSPKGHKAKREGVKLGFVVKT